MQNELGEHFDLDQYSDLDQYLDRIIKNQCELADSTVYAMTKHAAVAFAKGTDQMLLDAIIQKAKENGITDLYVLNEDFILSALKEKAEREKSKKHGHWVFWAGWSGTHDQRIDSADCSVCDFRHPTVRWVKDPKKELLKTCPQCGAIMDEEPVLRG